MQTNDAGRRPLTRVGFAVRALYAVIALSIAALAFAPPDRAAVFAPIVGTSSLLVHLTGLVATARAARHPRLSPVERRPWRWMCAWFVFQIGQSTAFTIVGSESRLAFADRPTPA